MAGEYTAEVLSDLEARVRRDLSRWGLSPQTAVTLLNVSENATFALSEPQGRELILRVHRVGYSSAPEISSELQWMNALREDGIVETAAPMRGTDGAWVQMIEPLREDSPRRLGVAFERLPGREPETRDAVQWFERLGDITARLHGHAASWPLPAGFRRKRWDFDAMVGAKAFWGPWRAARGLDAEGLAVLERALARLRQRLGEIGESAEVWGLVHADLRLANLLVDKDRLRVIDFDDCGFCWYLYDFAAAVSFIEHEPVLPMLLRSWLAGYRRVRRLPAEAVADIPAFVVLRRVLLTAWLASHAEVPFAREFGVEYTRGTVRLAQQWMDGDFLRSASS